MGAHREWADAVASVLEYQRNGRSRLIHAAFAVIIALQIAGPEGIAWRGIMPGPAWIYPLLAIGCMAVAVLVSTSADREQLAMEINLLKMKAMLADAEEAAARQPEQLPSSG